MALRIVERVYADTNRHLHTNYSVPPSDFRIIDERRGCPEFDSFARHVNVAKRSLNAARAYLRLDD